MSRPGRGISKSSGGQGVRVADLGCDALISLHVINEFHVGGLSTIQLDIMFYSAGDGCGIVFAWMYTHRHARGETASGYLGDLGHQCARRDE